jgi:hypothetical protein
LDSSARINQVIITSALVFYGENQSQDRCIQLALDYPAKTDPMLRSLYPTGLDIFWRELIKWLFKFSTGIEILFNYLVICIMNFKLEGE